MDERVNILADQEKLNNLIEDWSRKTAGKIKNRLPKDTGEATRRTESRTKKKNNEIEKVSFRIPRYVVFVTKGVGRGRGINSGKTKPNPAFNDVLNEEIPELTKLVTDNFHDRILNTNRAFIK